MTVEEQSSPAAGTTLPSGGVEDSGQRGGTIAPAPIKAIRLRHPWRTVLAVTLILSFTLFVIDASRRPAYDWLSVGKYLFDRRISEAAVITLQLMIYSMVIAIALGVILAVMRLTPNPVVKSIAWFYIWVFRGTPVYVQLVFWGLFSTIYQRFDIGIPFMDPWMSFENNLADNVFVIAVIGLGLNEASYMSEIVRAGLLSVNRGQSEAATALGMSWFQTMRRIILPQSMRVIIPPTGNEVISMLKTTSLVIAVPYGYDLYTRSRDISAEIFNPVPMLIVASIWYLCFTSILMVGQYFLEKRFARGVGDRRPDQKAAVDGGKPTVVPPHEGSPPISPGNGGWR